MIRKNSILLTLLFTVAVAAILTSCYDLKSRERLARAQQLLEQEYADSAANALDSIYLPRDMGREYYMQYLVTRVQAKYKAYRDVKNDTAVMEAVRYYEKKNKNPEQIALANYSAGCVMKERGENKRAIPYFKKAVNAATLTKNFKLQGLIYGNLAYVYHEELFQEQAIDYFKKAFSVYRQAKGTETNQMNTLSFLATNFLTNQQQDSALHYFKQALTIADAVHDRYYQTFIRNNIGLVYQQKKDYNLSNFILNESLHYSPDSSLRNKIQLNIAENYLKLTDFNALKEYLPVIKKSMESTSDLYYKSAAIDFLKEYEVRIGNYTQAFLYSEENYRIASTIFNQNQARALIEAEKEFDYTQKANEVKLAKQRQQNITLFFSLLLLLFLSIGLFFRFRARQKQKLKDVQTESERIIQEGKNQEMEKRLIQFINSNKQYKTLIRNTSELHTIIYNTAQAGEVVDKSSRFSKIKKALSQTEDTIRENLSNLSRSFLLEQDFSSKFLENEISDTEVIILFMLYNKEDRKDIAALLATNPHALTQRISRLKEKMKPLLTETEYQLFFQ
ncbi:MAG: tetratricopeptide repeat protein [Paludibacteraceae bacterium]